MTGPEDIPGVGRYFQVTPWLWRGAQPSRRGFEELKRRGLRTVVNLRTFHSDRDELQGLGLSYLHIYAQAWQPEDRDILAFLGVVRDRRNRPVFVHCQHGVDRTGSAVAVYCMLEEGWSAREAISEMRRFGFHGIWRVIERYLERFEPGRFRRMLRELPRVRVEVIR